MTAQTDFASLCSNFNKAVLDNFLAIAMTGDDLDPQYRDAIATQIGRSPQFVAHVHAAVSALVEMPELLANLQEKGHFDLDRLACLGRSLDIFVDLNLDELEAVVLEKLSTSATCPSPSALSQAIKKGDYKTSTLKKKDPKPTPQPAEPETTDAPDLSEVTFQRVNGGVRIVAKCTEEEGDLMERILHETAQQSNCSLFDALMFLFYGKNRPRIKVFALQLPSGKTYLEGKGWVTNQEMSSSTHLQSFRTVSEEEIAMMLADYSTLIAA